MENPKQGLEKRPLCVIGATQSKRPAHRVDPVESKSKQNSRAIGVCAQGVVHAPKSMSLWSAEETWEMMTLHIFTYLYTSLYDAPVISCI